MQKARGLLLKEQQRTGPANSKDTAEGRLTWDLSHQAWGSQWPDTHEANDRGQRESNVTPKGCFEANICVLSRTIKEDTLRGALTGTSIQPGTCRGGSSCPYRPDQDGSGPAGESTSPKGQALMWGPGWGQSFLLSSLTVCAQLRPLTACAQLCAGSDAQYPQAGP